MTLFIACALSASISFLASCLYTEHAAREASRDYDRLAAEIYNLKVRLYTLEAALAPFTSPSQQTPHKTKP